MENEKRAPSGISDPERKDTTRSSAARETSRTRAMRILSRSCRRGAMADHTLEKCTSHDGVRRLPRVAGVPRRQREVFQILTRSKTATLKATAALSDCFVRTSGSRRPGRRLNQIRRNPVSCSDDDADRGTRPASACNRAAVRGLFQDAEFAPFSRAAPRRRGVAIIGQGPFPWPPGPFCLSRVWRLGVYPVRSSS